MFKKKELNLLYHALEILGSDYQFYSEDKRRTSGRKLLEEIEQLKEKLISIKPAHATRVKSEK